jgi:hypothetical protein
MSLADTLGRDSMKAPSLYPSLHSQSTHSLLPESPSKSASLRKARDKEAKEAKIMQQQLEKLDRERQKVAEKAEKARKVSQEEKERVAAMERKIAAQKEAQKEQERRVAAQREEEERRIQAQREEERRIEAHQEDERRRAAQREQEEKQLALMREEEERIAAEQRALAAQQAAARPTRTSPRKTKAQLEAEGRAATAAQVAQEVEEVEMTDAAPEPPRSLSRSQIGRPKDTLKRPVRPTTRPPAAANSKAPVVIRVNTGSRPFQPSTAALSASLGESLQPVASQPASSASKTRQPPARGLQTKASSDSLKSVTSTTKVKALEAAARKREAEERETQRKRDAKAEMAAQLEAKRNAQRALERKQEIEKAKLARPPPPAPRPNPHAPVDREKPLPAAPREAEPMHRRTIQRDEHGRVTNTFQNMSKAPPKRPLPAEEARRPTINRNAPSYQQLESKRRKTEDEWDDHDENQPPRGARAPPQRPSSIRQKVRIPPGSPKVVTNNTQDAPMKSLFPSGYSAAPASMNTVHNAPHSSVPAHMQQKPSRPLDLAQTSKAPINFAPNPAHKTPARQMPMQSNPNTGKSISKPSAKSSPRYANGELIELPDIHTDSEDEDSEAEGFAVPDWAASPNLFAGLVAQEGKDPSKVFGPPTELKMEEVFRNKERWGRFRQRTSSANWSGGDRLTEEEVRKDLEARERLRREGGWSYGLS